MAELRGVVLESGTGWAIILLENGEYKKVRTKGILMPGQLYQGKNQPGYAKYAVAAAIFLMIFVGGADFFNVVTYAQVSSGVEIGVNRWNRVVSLSAENYESEMLLEKISKGQKLEEALEIVLKKALAKNNSPDLPPITVSIQNANNKPIPPGIAKKVEAVTAQNGTADYDLIQLEGNDQGKKVYGLTVKDIVHPGQDVKDQNRGKDGPTDQYTPAPNDNNPGNEDNGNGNNKVNGNNDTNNHARDKKDQLNDDVDDEDAVDSQLKKGNANRSNKAVQKK